MGFDCDPRCAQREAGDVSSLWTVSLWKNADGITFGGMETKIWYSFTCWHVPEEGNIIIYLLIICIYYITRSLGQMVLLPLKLKQMNFKRNIILIPSAFLGCYLSVFCWRSWHLEHLYDFCGAGNWDRQLYNAQYEVWRYKQGIWGDERRKMFALRHPHVRVGGVCDAKLLGSEFYLPILIN